MSIVIFGDIFTFPEGDAATNRAHTYAKGFLENGVDVHVICFDNNYDSSIDGEIDGIKFYHPFRHKKRNRFIFIRQLQKIHKYVKTYRLFRKLEKKEHILAINICTNLLATHVFSWILSRITRSELIIEGNEHPLRHFKKGVVKKVYGKFKLWVEISLCDGIFCISHFLIDYYKGNGVPESRLFLVPSTVDPNRFANVSQRPSIKPYIGYFGSLTFKRDNVDGLIKAFASISSKYSDFQLILGGFCSDDEKNDILKLIQNLGIQDKVQMLGYLKREEIINYVYHAHLLVMVRSNNLESKASYPSKLSEFLASAKPVISVNVGEIPLYLTDGKNIFLAEPENVEALASKMDYVLSNYDRAREVGLLGKELTDTIFNYNYQAKRMLDFIYSLK